MSPQTIMSNSVIMKVTGSKWKVKVGKRERSQDKEYLLYVKKCDHKRSLQNNGRGHYITVNWIGMVIFDRRDIQHFPRASLHKDSGKC